MKRLSKLLLAIPLLQLLTGCWDRNEINDYAFWIGSSLDLNKDGSIRTGAQIAVPAQFYQKAGKGGGGRGNIVLTASGTSLIDSMQGLQDKLPRKIFIGHRRAVFIGEKLARLGIGDIMDQFSRNPDTRLRTDIFVVKGGEGKKALELNSPFNQFSSIAAVDQDRFCRIGDVALRDFFMDATRQGIRPILPVIEIAPHHRQENNKIFTIQAAAVFNRKLEMVGILGKHDSLNLFWIRNILKDRFMTETSDGGYFSIYASNLKSSIRTRVDGDQIKFEIRLKGTGRVLENRSGTDISKSRNLKEAEQQFNRKTKEKVETLIRTVQTKYGQDIFGLGEELHREYPYYWKTVKNNWDRIFPKAIVSVEVDLRIKRVGNLGKPLIFVEGA